MELERTDLCFDGNGKFHVADSVLCYEVGWDLSIHLERSFRKEMFLYVDV